MLENNAVKRRAFCMRKRVKYVTAHAQKFSDITICILVPWYMYSLIRTFHLSELFTYPNFFFGNLSNWVRITKDALYIDFLIILIPTPLVSVLFCSSIPTFLFIFLMLFVLVPVLFCNYILCIK